MSRADRDAVVLALIGRPAGLPGPERIDLDGFWARFDALAPLHVRAAIGLTSVLVGQALPRWWCHRRRLASLDAETADQVVQRAARSALLGPALDAVSIVACFAYLSDEQVEPLVRGPLQVDPS